MTRSSRWCRTRCEERFAFPREILQSSFEIDFLYLCNNGLSVKNFEPDIYFFFHEVAVFFFFFLSTKKISDYIIRWNSRWLRREDIAIRKLYCRRALTFSKVLYSFDVIIVWRCVVSKLCICQRPFIERGDTEALQSFITNICTTETVDCYVHIR